MKAKKTYLVENEARDTFTFYVKETKPYLDLQKKIYTVGANLGHELYGHILQGDEETWNPEFYTDGKLDYKKLLIKLLEEVFETLEIDGSKWYEYDEILEEENE